MPRDEEKKLHKPASTGRVSANWKNFVSSNTRNPGHSRTKRPGRPQPSTSKDQKLWMELVEQNHSTLIIPSTNVFGLDCEMVGVASAQKDMLARVSIVDSVGNCIYDKYVLPTEAVTDYRTWVSGIRAKDLRGGEPYEKVRDEVSGILENSIIVGHALSHDFKVLNLKHPKHLIRDTSTFPVFREMFSNKTPALRNLARLVLGVNIQGGEHSSVQDARATVQLYMSYRDEWEAYLEKKNSRNHLL